MQVKEIKLGDYIASDQRVIVGADTGNRLRTVSQIDKLIGRNVLVRIILPDNVWSVNPSFWETFLTGAVKKLENKTTLAQHIEVIATNDYEPQSSFYQAINRLILRPSKPKNKFWIDW
jgi:hypothetical protein